MTGILAAGLGTDVFRGFLQGLPPGTVYALIALGFVLTYKTSGVFNLAFGAQAYMSAVVYFKAHTEWGWPIVPSVVLSVVILAPLVGFVLEALIFRHLRTATPVAKLVVTIGLTLALPAIIDLAANFQSVAGVTPEGIVPDGASVFYDPFGVYAFSRNELVAMVIALLAMLGLGALFKFTVKGLQMRAVVESPRMTELNGWASDRISSFAWMLSSFFAGLAGVLIAPRFNTLAANDFFNLVVVAIAAAAVGKLVSLPRALLGGLGLGILIAEINTFLPRWAETYEWLAPLQDSLTPAIPFIVLFGVIVLVPGIGGSREAADPLAGVDPPPPALGGRSQSGRSARFTWGVGAALVLVVGSVVFFRADDQWMFLVTQAAIMATIFLSITVITGMAGQISLAQGAFAATGAFTVFQTVDRYDLSVVAGALLGGVVAAGVAVLLSLPLRRVAGIWVAIGTLAFAFFFDSVIIKMSWVSGEASLLQGTDVPRPVIGPWDFADDRAFLVLCLVVLAIVGVVVVQIREGTTGQALRALRGSQVAAQSIGISPSRSLLIAFALSGFIAGLGGALLAVHQENVNYGTNFAPFAALFWLVLVVTLGSRTFEGAAAAAFAFAVFDTLVLKGTVFEWILRSPDRVPGVFPLDPTWRFVLFGLATIQFARHPEGVIESGRRRKAEKAARKAAAEAGAAGGGAGPAPDRPASTPEPEVVA